jgi:hypothetical protein
MFSVRLDGFEPEKDKSMTYSDGRPNKKHDGELALHNNISLKPDLKYSRLSSIVLVST